MKRIQVLVIGSRTIVVDSLARALNEHGGFISQVCPSYTEATDCAIESPQIVLIDVDHDTIGESLQACRALRDAAPHMVLLLPRQLLEGSTLVLEAIEAGATGVLIQEDIDCAGLVAALEQLQQGYTLLDPPILREALAQRRVEAVPTTSADMTEHLTAREREVCAQMMAGASTTVIADQLGISERTVQNYINNIIAKLGVSNRTEAVVQLYQTQQMAINA